MSSTAGEFLNTLLGYDAAPSMLQITLYWSYLVIALAVFLFMPGRPGRPRRVPQRPVSESASQV